MKREEKEHWLRIVKDACYGCFEAEEFLVEEGRRYKPLRRLLQRLNKSYQRLWSRMGSGLDKKKLTLESICEGIQGYSERMYEDLDLLAKAASAVFGGYYEEC